MTERLPLFPLGSVLFPGLLLPLHVFEERYRRLVADLEAGPEPHRFGVVAIRDGREVAPTGPGVPDGSSSGPMAGFGQDPAQAFHTVGCVAEVATVRPQPDGGYELLASGTTRFRVLSIDTTGDYLVAETEPIPEDPEVREEGKPWEEPADGSGVPQALVGAVLRAFREYQKRLAGAREASLAESQELPDDPTVLSYLVAAASVLEVPVKQRLLAAAGSAERLSQELELLRRETAVLGWLPSLPAVDLTRRAFSPN
ncbi:LON peptidase substrate-binding domain-containing protein [Phaeacidiphilus oryzae]|uniref:LON peptidase substrate-binding domain-containing protein n=1 Tax=Phaeacidiphilus oryzae TaxID=348818 RepID=UPI000568DC04|nr:LON peptidase substrate-binding domain-containing protein [Phaeacidiphilus oryzae]